MKTTKELVGIRRLVFAWFFFFVCCKAASHSSLESTFTSKAAGSYKQLGIRETQHENGDGSKLTMKPNKECDHPIKTPTSRAYKTLKEAVQLGNVHRTGNGLISQMKKANRGVYGGGDLLRPRRKGAASSVKRSPSSLLSIVLRAVAIALLLFVFY